MESGLFFGIVGGVVGLLLGGLITLLKLQHQRLTMEGELRLCEQQLAQERVEVQSLQERYQDKAQALRTREQEWGILQTQWAALQEKVTQQAIWRQEIEQLKQDLDQWRERHRIQGAELQAVTIRLEETQLSTKEKQRLLIDSEQRLSTQFENLANRIFEHSGKRVEEQNKQSLAGLLNPLREQLEGFHRQVQESFGQEARERHTLTHEIRELQKLNTQMASETVNLTKALKGDNKTQGNWGEVVLSRVLELSGLREGYEYQTQVALTSEGNSRLQPDVIIRLPQGKDVVIDAKMSLVAYERYFNADEDTQREQAIQDHIASIRTHIRLLGGKEYQRLAELHTLDYVLMFIPLEPAFITAIDREPMLIKEAQRHNIMLVSPTTLLVALRTINNLWRYEHQSQNAQKIAERAAKLYDKLRLFIEDMESLGQSLAKSQTSYQQAMNKLVQGRGNLIGQVESFRQLGIEVKKTISPTLVASAQQEDNQDNVPYPNYSDDPSTAD